MSLWTVPNNSNIGTIQESKSFTYNLPLVDQNNTSTILLSGKLPPGLYLKNNQISGVPEEVSLLTTFRFVIRAASLLEIADRTFSIKIDGADVPTWITTDGLLPVGPNNLFYILDESYVDFQLEAFDTDKVTGQTLSYWIDSKGGVLPPGLSLSSTGRIYGFVKPVLYPQTKNKSGYYDGSPYDSLSYDHSSVETLGFDSYGYDLLSFDYSEYFSQPKKLNRNYEFIVSISDGNTVTKRKFKIFVIGDDTFYVDTQNITAASSQYTTDVTSLRSPIWKTDPYLGVLRADNYQTLKLDIYEVIARNPVIYSIEAFNPDGSPSTIPIGMQFDTTTSELFGIIPYQPATTVQYDFTITATRIGKVRNAPAEPDVNTFPIKLGNDVVYRNYAKEGLGAITVYTTKNFIEGKVGIKFYQPAAGVAWRFENHKTKVTLYSNSSVFHPWDIITWYSDLNHTIPVVGPTLTLIETAPTNYTYNYDTVSTSRTFTVKVLGDIDTSIRWITPSNLGIIEVEQISTLLVEAKCDNGATVNYQIISGSLPPGLRMDSIGQISGKVNQFSSPRITKYDFILDGGNTTIDRQFTFEVLASDLAGTVQLSRKFTLRIAVPYTNQFSDIYVKPMLKVKNREDFRSFISNSDIFEISSLYRPGDPNFGVQDSMAMLVFAGIETKRAVEYMSMVAQNHTRKHFRFGDIKIAQAKNPASHQTLYEVIYVEVVDNLEIDKTHLPRTIHTSKERTPYTIDNEPNHLTIDKTNVIGIDSCTEYKQPSSISLWRQRIHDLGINDRHHLPLWMRTVQDGTYTELDYVPAIVLCFCKTGHAAGILLNINHYIKTTNFNFNQFDYDIDRYIITAVQEYQADKYIIFNTDRTQIA